MELAWIDGTALARQVRPPARRSVGLQCREAVRGNAAEDDDGRIERITERRRVDAFAELRRWKDGFAA